MARGVWMARYARWHIWLGWLIGVPLVLWTMSGVAMVVRPIEEVRGEHLRVQRPEQAIPAGAALFTGPAPAGVTEITQRMDHGRLVAILTHADGHRSRLTQPTLRPDPVGAAEARAIVAREVKGGDRVASIAHFSARNSPLDLRKPVAAWRVALADGTHVYVGEETGRIEAIRTRWWRFYDVMWGIHIMDLQTREDAHNAFTIVFGTLASLGALLGCALLFRRRKRRVAA